LHDLQSWVQVLVTQAKGDWRNEVTPKWACKWRGERPKIGGAGFARTPYFRKFPHELRKS